jgi:hypothetical protein
LFEASKRRFSALGKPGNQGEPFRYISGSRDLAMASEIELELEVPRPVARADQGPWLKRLDVAAAAAAAGKLRDLKPFWA